VPSAAHADLDDGDIDGDVGEPPQGRGGEHLEVGELKAKVVLEHLDVLEGGGEALVVDGFAVVAHALVQALEVGRRVGTDAQPVGGHEGADHAYGRALAVGPGDMDDPVGRLRVTE